MRFRQDILVADLFGDQRPASGWLNSHGRARLLKDMAVTGDFHIVPGVVTVHDKRMKEPWCLATSRTDLAASEKALTDDGLTPEPKSTFRTHGPGPKPYPDPATRTRPRDLRSMVQIDDIYFQ